jgi:hypothetical protein
MLKRSVAVAILLLTSACRQADNPIHARLLAASVKADCEKGIPSAPNPALGHHLQRLCDCAYAKISAAPMSGGDDNDVIQSALKDCTNEVGGVADAQDYRATGTQLPPKEADNLAVDANVSNKPAQ